MGDPSWRFHTKETGMTPETLSAEKREELPSEERKRRREDSCR